MLWPSIAIVFSRLFMLQIICYPGVFFAALSKKLFALRMLTEAGLAQELSFPQILKKPMFPTFGLV